MICNSDATVTIRSLLINHGLINIIRFVSRFTTHLYKKFCKQTSFSTSNQQNSSVNFFCVSTKQGLKLNRTLVVYLLSPAHKSRGPTILSHIVLDSVKSVRLFPASDPSLSNFFLNYVRIHPHQLAKSPTVGEDLIIVETGAHLTTRRIKLEDPEFVPIY